MTNSSLQGRYLIQPISALRVVKGNHSFITETSQPLAAVQVWEGKQLSAEHGHQASSGESQGEPASSIDGFLSPRYHQLGQHWTQLC